MWDAWGQKPFLGIRLFLEFILVQSGDYIQDGVSEGNVAPNIGRSVLRGFGKNRGMFRLEWLRGFSQTRLYLSLDEGIDCN